MKRFFVFLILAAAGFFAWQYRASLIYYARSIMPENSDTIQGSAVEDLGGSLEVIATDLDTPWEIAFLPDGDILVTELSGSLKRIGGDKVTHEVGGLEDLGNKNVLGLVLHPDFEQNHWVYLYIEMNENDKRSDRVYRYRLEGDQLTDRTTIAQNIPSAGKHDGGRLAFGPDNKLYVTTGDAGQSFLSQDRNSLVGKILRYEEDGRVPTDNPFGTPVWSFGHHNVQGLTWGSNGVLWATEHGRSGLLTGFDEINQIEGGQNYGWPVIHGDEAEEGLQSPFKQSGSREAWGPAAAVFWRNSVFFGGLRGESLYQLLYSEDGDSEVLAHFHEEFGRIMAVKLGPGGNLYFTTNNRDGARRVHEGDDKIIRIRPESLKIPETLQRRFR